MLDLKLRAVTKFGPTRVAPALLLTALAAVAVRMLSFKLASQPAFIDFLTMWTGGRLANVDPTRIYDSATIDRAQTWLLGAAAHDRPFPYPPSSLLVFGPLGRLPFWTASAIWMGLTIPAFCFVAAWVNPRHRLLATALIVLLPGAIWAALSGQCAFLTGALAIAAVALLGRRPWLAGVLLGLAVALKPTVLLMAPFALLALGQWRSMLAAALAGSAAIALAAIAYGIEPWLHWLTTGPTYLTHITTSPRFQSSIVSPTGLAAQLGVTGVAMSAWRAAFAVVGLWVVWRAFRRETDLATRLTALFGASLVASPYAMNYETTLLAPGAVLALMTARDPRTRTHALIAYVALALAGLPVISAAALLVFLALSLWPALSAPSHTLDAAT